jgi:type I restriction enzyme S subunit
VTKEDMQNIKLIIPLDSNLINHFIEQIKPIFRQIEVFSLKNINLRKTRDLLLPRLISGEIDVENLAINTGIQP